MYKILYLNNFLPEELRKKRNNYKNYSQAANNKIMGITNSLLKNNCKVMILSLGFTRTKSFKYFKHFKSKLNENLYFASAFDIPVFRYLWSIISSIFLMIKLNKKYKFDHLIFYNYNIETAIPAWFAKTFLGIPIIVDYEDGYFAVDQCKKIEKIIINKLENILCNKIQGAILVTSKLQSRIKDKKNVIVRGIINEEIYNIAVSNKREINNKEPVILYSGGLDEERGIKILLESLRFTSQKFKLVVTGQGILESYVREYSDERLSFIGFIKNYDEYKKILLGADILINPQCSNIEFGQASFPSKVFEYLSARKVIVSSDVSDINEIADNPMLIYNNDNPQKLALKIDEALKLLLNCNKYNEYIISLDKLVLENSYDKIGQKIINDIFN